MGSDFLDIQRNHHPLQNGALELVACLQVWRERKEANKAQWRHTSSPTDTHRVPEFTSVLN